MVKLIIQIPCLNEEGTLPATLQDLPREVPGVDVVEWLIIDDGSRDRTIEVAREHGVDHVVRHMKNMGLAQAFKSGMDACLALGADIIVNTDADNQYAAADIAALVAPIVANEAQIVIGARPIAQIAHFSPLKKFFQTFGSWVVRTVSHTDVRDAPSGFRAFSREAAMTLNVFNDYTYTLETIIQAGLKNLSIVSVPVRVNADLRPSRLVRSIPTYIKRSMRVIFFTFMVYKPFRFFALPGIASFGLGFLIGLRFFVYWMVEGGAGHIQSLILAALLMGAGLALVVVGLVADLIAVNRKLLEKIDLRLRKLEDRLRSRD